MNHRSQWIAMLGEYDPEDSDFAFVFNLCEFRTSHKTRRRINYETEE